MVGMAYYVCNTVIETLGSVRSYFHTNKCTYNCFTTTVTLFQSKAQTNTPEHLKNFKVLYNITVTNDIKARTYTTTHVMILSL